MTEPSSTFAGIIVIDQLPPDVRAAWPADVAEQSELRQALLCLARECPLDAFDDEPFAPHQRHARPTGASVRRRATVCVSARLERLTAELNAEAGDLIDQIDRAKRA